MADDFELRRGSMACALLAPIRCPSEQGRRDDHRRRKIPSELRVLQGGDPAHEHRWSARHPQLPVVDGRRGVRVNGG